MADTPPNPSDREQRLQDVLAGYMQAVEAGQTPDRQELLAQHPDLAGELASFFANRDDFAGMAARDVLPAAVAAPHPSESPIEGANGPMNGVAGEVPRISGPATKDVIVQATRPVGARRRGVGMHCRESTAGSRRVAARSTPHPNESIQGFHCDQRAGGRNRSCRGHCTSGWLRIPAQSCLDQIHPKRDRTQHESMPSVLAGGQRFAALNPAGRRPAHGQARQKTMLRGLLSSTTHV
jgi:hypothetical protein